MLDITPTQGFPHMYDFIGNTAKKFGREAKRAANPIVLVVLSFVIMIYYVLFSYLGLGGNSAGAAAAPSSPGMTVIEVLMWGVFVFLVLINGIQYFFNVDIKTGIKNLFSPVPEVDIAVITPPNQESTEGDITEDDAGVPEITIEPQVFHIPNNVYTYNDAKALCKAYGGDLANYEQIEKAYQDGGEWCGFGWSKVQMALYPTQTETWKGLQKIPGHKHDCGRPGINGGYIANKNVRFGANCYGYKPKMTHLERKMLEQSNPFPVTRRELRFEKRVNHFKNKLSDILVSPFNYERWSQI